MGKLITNPAKVEDLDSKCTANTQAIANLDSKKLKYMDVVDSTPVNVVGKTGGIVNFGNFVSAMCSDNMVFVDWYYNTQYSTVYIRLRDANGAAVSGNKTVRIWYV